MLTTLAQAAGAAATGTDSETYLLWGFILLGVALVLLAMEFFIPSGGLIGILCGLAAITSVVAFFLHDAAWGIGMGLAYIFLTPLILIFMFKLWINSPVGEAMILGSAQDTVTESEETTMASEQERQRRLAELRSLIGAEGVTETALRPVGSIRIGDRRVDGMAESGIIEANTPIVVTEVYDNQIKVRPR
jgi:membrane-bound ClpP family serine protease